jgi:hypothetical protein
MRTPLLSLALLVSACGAGKPTSTPANHAEATPPPATIGTSGMAGLDWGASADAVRAVAPRATPNKAGGLWATGTTDGITSITSFKLGVHGLEEIDIEWTEGFVSMQDCATHWKTLRAKYDGRFGASQADNLAAYWKTPTASIQLACNPNDSGAGVLSMTYAKPDGT